MTLTLTTYDDGVTFVINEYIKNANNIILIEYGRGTSELAQSLIDIGLDVTIVEDVNQNIFSPNPDRYEGLESIIVKHNVLSAAPCPDIKADVVYASIPHMIPNVPNPSIYPKIRDAFKKMKSMVNPGGFLITVDYNTPTINQAVSELFDETTVTALIDTETGAYVAVMLCE